MNGFSFKKGEGYSPMSEEDKKRLQEIAKMFFGSPDYERFGLPARPVKTKEIEGVTYAVSPGGLYLREDGTAFRYRRGKLVEIPAEWVGQVTRPQTIRKRESKEGQGRRFKKKAQR